MTNEELVELYQQGNKHALDELIEKNKGIVFKLSNKYYTGKTNSIDKEDLEQEGFMGLIIAAGKYDLDHDSRANFITYAVFWINQKITRFLKHRNTNDETSLNTPIGETGDSQILDFIEGVDYSFENIEDKLYLKQLRADLDQVMSEETSLKEREILKLHYGWYDNKCMALEELGAIYNINKSIVNSIKNKAIRKIRGSKWGRIKIKEKYGQMKISSFDSINRSLEALDFTYKYLSKRG